MGLAQYDKNANFSLPEAMKTEIDRLRTTNEVYKLYAPEMDLYLGAFEGGPDFATEKNIFKHIRENLEDYKDRVARVHYMNYCEPLVSFFTNFIFSETIDRNGGSNKDWYNSFAADVNRKGDNIDDFMRTVSDDQQIFGMDYILVDSPVMPSGSTELSVADEEEQGIRPYWVNIRPNEIVDWVVDDFDNFIYVKRLQMLNTVTDVGEILKVEQYTEWFRSKVTVSKIDVTDPSKLKLLPVQEMDNSIGEIPIVVNRYKRSKRYPFMGNSFLRDFAYNNREIMNMISLQQEFLYRQAFNILAVETESNIPLADQQDGVVGSANSITVPKGAAMPQYVSPPVAPAEHIGDYMQMVKREMFLRAAQDTVNELFNGEKSSGFSQAQSFSKTVPFISSRADGLERTEMRLMTLTAKMAGKVWDGKIKYKDRYEITNLTDAITQLTMLARDLQLPSETFVKEELKRIVHEFDNKLPPDLMAQCEKQIESMDFKDWMNTQKEALIGPEPSSPAAQQKPKSKGTMKEAASEAKTSNTGSTKKLKGKGS